MQAKLRRNAMQPYIAPMPRAVIAAAAIAATAVIVAVSVVAPAKLDAARTPAAGGYAAAPAEVVMLPTVVVVDRSARVVSAQGLPSPRGGAARGAARSYFTRGMVEAIS
jgi:hypothetical protein